jgi:Rrf2 family protein
MKLFAKTEYACIAVLELSQKYSSGEPVRINDIAAMHGIPSRFLVQILLQLKGSGLVMSTRGAAGGYQLAKPPEKISLGEVMSAVDGENKVSTAQTNRSATSRVLLKTWKEIAEKEEQILRHITFAHLVERCQSEIEKMYYI